MRWIAHRCANLAREGDFILAYLFSDRDSFLSSFVTTYLEAIEHSSAVPDDRVRSKDEAPFPNWYNFHGDQGIPPLRQTGLTHEKLRRWGNRKAQ